MGMVADSGGVSKVDKTSNCFLSFAPLPLGFGTGKLRSLAGGLSARSAKRLLEIAFDEGITFFDTAPSYGQGQAERVIGRLSLRIRHEIFICSKIGYSYGRGSTLVNVVKPFVRPMISFMPRLREAVNNSRKQFHERGSITVEILPTTIRTSVVGTLRRLKRDCLDILLLHDPSVESLSDENVSVLALLTREGLIRRWGVSTSDTAVAHQSIRTKGLTVLQLPVHPSWVVTAGDLFVDCLKAKIDVIANHVLSAALDQPNKLSPDSLLDRFEFALRQPGVSIVLCGTTNVEHLRANTRVVKVLAGNSGVEVS
jgi:aryl-alcohol dehydrogenase-like predicted oxidoreductase